VTAEVLLRELDRLVDAPNSVERLRRFVFALAMRGVLSASDAGGDLAADQHHRPLESLKNRGEPYRLPRGWRWSTTAEIGTARLGKMLDKAKNRGTPRRYLRNINVRWFDFDLSDVKVMPFEDSELGEFALRAGDVLICEGGEPGRAAVWDERDTDIYFQKAIHRVRLHPEVLPLFLVYYLRGAAYEGRLAPHATGATFQHLTGQGLARLPVPVPPLDEQCRIVERIDELMILCDKLGAAQDEREARRDLLRTTSLRNLVAPEESKEHARFFLSHSPRMLSRPEHVAAVRQAIYDLAVRGRLVRQDPDEEPAAAWLGRLSNKSFAEAAEPADHPVGWVPVILSDVAPMVTSGSRGWAQFYSDHGALFIRSQNVKYGYTLMSDRQYVAPPARSEGTRTGVDVGDLLVVITGDVGHVAVWDRDLGEAYVSQHVALVKPLSAEVSPWLLLALMAPSAGRRQLRGSIYGGKPGLNLTQVRNLAFRLPPLLEQRRIVAKVNELMAVCDELERTLATERSERARLLEALLCDALEGGVLQAREPELLGLR
jgi:type I restriction enzyme S subunit